MKITIGIATVLLLLVSLGWQQVAAFHPFHEPVIHLSDYHDPQPNVAYGVSWCYLPADPTAEIT